MEKVGFEKIGKNLFVSVRQFGHGGIKKI